jgi:hypothetical protein
MSQQPVLLNGTSNIVEVITRETWIAEAVRKTLSEFYIVQTREVLMNNLSVDRVTWDIIRLADELERSKCAPWACTLSVTSGGS